MLQCHWTFEHTCSFRHGMRSTNYDQKVRKMLRMQLHNDSWRSKSSTLDSRIMHIWIRPKYQEVHSVSFRFHLCLSLSVNSQITSQPYTSHLKYHLAIHTQKCNFFLFWNVQPNCHLAVFNKKGTKISEQSNGNSSVHKSFSHSHSNSNSNANGIGGIQNTHQELIRWTHSHCNAKVTQFDFYHPPAKLLEGNIFSWVCLLFCSLGRGVGGPTWSLPSTHALEIQYTGTPPTPCSWWPHCTGTLGRAGSSHPTGMPSCLIVSIVHITGQYWRIWIDVVGRESMWKTVT